MAEKEDNEYVDFSEAIAKLKNSWNKINTYKYFEHIVLSIIIGISFFVRTRNLDSLGGKYLVGLDPYYYFRLAGDVLANGKVLLFDTWRNPPLGSDRGFDLFPYIMAYWSKFLEIFGVSREMAHIIYPPVAMIGILIFFYLWLRLLVSKRVAIIASLFLAVIPGFVFRTAAGFADHEAISIMFMFLSLWLFTKADLMKISRNKYLMMFGAGLAAFGMGVTWVGYPMLIIVISGYLLSKMLLSKERDGYPKYFWFLTFAALMFLAGKLHWKSYGWLIGFFSFGVLLVYDLLKDRKFFVPNSVLSILIVGVGGLLLNSLFGFFDVGAFLWNILHAGGGDKLAGTTSEIARTYVTSGNSYLDNYGYLTFISLFGVFFLSWKLFMGIGRRLRITLSSIAVGSIFVITMGNWNSDFQILGSNYIYLMLTVLFGLVSYYLYLYYNKRKDFDVLSNLKNINLVMPIIFFLIMGLLARTAVRFIFVFAPAIALLSAVAFDDFLKHAKRYKFAQLGVVLLIGLLSFGAFGEAAHVSDGMRSGLPGMWEDSMDWIRENTPEGSVISHWWDYGYWTQTIGNRPSISDGGKPGGQFFIYTLARYGMTHDNIKESMEYFAAHEVDYLLYSGEELGKYGAFATLGSDKYNDRVSVIGIFALQGEDEARDGKKLVYSGSWPIDSPIIEGKRVIPAGAGRINKVELYFDDAEEIILAPKATVVANGFEQEYEIPCLVTDSFKITYEVGSEVIDGCVRLIPGVQGEYQNPVAGLLFMSEKVKDGLFARLYINGEQLPEFTQTYSSDVPIMIYNGQLVGPVKIWRLNYPDNLENVARFLDSDKMPEFEENYNS